ncbi:MAG: Glycine betaine/L-proline transport ATP binding subunit [Thermotogales bacterium 46_20]|nr:MAG: Glycine betaine/L-proline transport ATP binding subunit [Thermotogales bacterium 46_20]
MAIELKKLRKVYGESTVAVDDVDLTFEDKKISILIGPSGCGKTTTLKMINRLIERTSGDIIIDGRSIDEIGVIELRRSIGYVIQEIGLFPHMTVFDNIAVVPRLLKWPEDKIKKRVMELLDLMNLDPDEHPYKYPVQLSGGQKQRVGVARGLAADPEILLMDEPFGAIDPINREKLQDAFIEIQEQINKTIVFVTHDIREAIKLGDNIAIFNEGKLVQYDETMTVINEPADDFVENLLGSDRGLRSMELVRVQDHYDTDFFALELTEKLTVGDALKEIEKTDRRYAYVLNEKKRLAGYVVRKKIEKANKSDPLKKHVKETESIHPSSSLLEAMSLMMTSGLSAVPVVDDRGRVRGVVRFSALMEMFGSVDLTGSD